MTETIPKPAASTIAEEVRHSRGPTGDMAELAAQSRRLGSSLAVALKWMEAAGAKSGEPGTMFTHAQYAYDQIEEELCRVIFEMEVLERQSAHAQVAKEMHAGAGEAQDLSDAQAREATISDLLLAAYCTLREAPEEVVGEKRERYRLMGALLAAMDGLREEA